MKIFELRSNKIDEREWIAADTNIHALKVYQETTDQNLVDFDEVDEIVEIPEDQWSKFTITNPDCDPDDPEDWKSQTFAEYMKTCNHPTIIAGTMYE